MTDTRARDAIAEAVNVRVECYAGSSDEDWSNEVSSSVLAALSDAGLVVLDRTLLDELLRTTTLALSTTLGDISVFRRAVVEAVGPTT